MRRYLVALAMSCLCAAPAHAQDQLLQSCAQQIPSANVPASVQQQFRFMCAQVVNSLSNLQPSVGIAFSGGNPVLGTGTTLGTRLGVMPRVSVTARANVALAEVPDLFGDYAARLSDSEQALEAMETLGAPVGSVQGDISIGIFNGFSLAPMVGGVGAIDLLGSVSVLPRISDYGMSRGITNVGAGARIGLLKQGLAAPGISVSGMYRRMSDIGFGEVDASDPAQGDPGAFRTDLETLSFRAVASKGILMFDFALGAGYDRYKSDIGVDWVVTCASTDCRNANNGDPIPLRGAIDGDLSTAAWNVFGDLSLNLLMLNLVAELGYQKATEVLGVEDLEKANLPSQRMTVEDLKGGRFFGSLGLRLAL